MAVYTFFVLGHLCLEKTEHKNSAKEKRAILDKYRIEAETKKINLL